MVLLFSNCIDSTTVFPIPTYVILKDDILTDSLSKELSGIPNLTLIQQPRLLTVQDLNASIGSIHEM